jgi:K+-sensing histidine kinase KdpD
MRIFNKRSFLNWRGYLIAIGTVLLATWLKYLAQPDIIPADVPILYIAAILLTATFFGLGPSILACLLSVLAYDFFFVQPVYTLTALRIEDYPIIVIFLLVGGLISYLSAVLRNNIELANLEIETRKKTAAELTQYRDHLEDMVKRRTSELEKANIVLKQEVNERQKAEEKLRESEQRLRQSNEMLEAVTRGTRVIMAIVDTDYRYIFFNKGYAEEMKKLTGKDIMLGSSMVEILSHMPQQQKVTIEEWSPVLRGEISNKTLEFGDPLFTAGFMMCFTLRSGIIQAR